MPMRTEKKKMISGEYYLSGDAVLIKKERRRAIIIAPSLNVTEYR
jgi:maltose O-acetyltransferase